VASLGPHHHLLLRSQAVPEPPERLLKSARQTISFNTINYGPASFRSSYRQFSGGHLSTTTLRSLAPQPPPDHREDSCRLRNSTLQHSNGRPTLCEPVLRGKSVRTEYLSREPGVDIYPSAKPSEFVPGSSGSIVALQASYSATIRAYTSGC